MNRYVGWNSDGEMSWIEHEPDPRHAEMIVNSLNLESAKRVTTPSVTKDLEKMLATFTQLDASRTRFYRSVVMRAAYLSQDRPDLSFSAKELARDMQRGTENSITNLKRFGRDLKKVHDMFNFSSNRHPLETFYGWTCMVRVLMRGTSKHSKSRRA